MFLHNRQTAVSELDLRWNLTIPGLPTPGFLYTLPERHPPVASSPWAWVQVVSSQELESKGRGMMTEVGNLGWERTGKNTQRHRHTHTFSQNHWSFQVELARGQPHCLGFVLQGLQRLLQGNWVFSCATSLVLYVVHRLPRLSFLRGLEHSWLNRPWHTYAPMSVINCFMETFPTPKVPMLLP